MRALRIASAVEAVSLVVLLVKLFTVHLRTVSSLTGPLHGTAYLCVIGAALLMNAPGPATLLTLVPGIGGVLALRRIRHHPTREEGASR